MSKFCKILSHHYHPLGTPLQAAIIQTTVEITVLINNILRRFRLTAFEVRSWINDDILQKIMAVITYP